MCGHQIFLAAIANRYSNYFSFLTHRIIEPTQYTAVTLLVGNLLYLHPTNLSTLGYATSHLLAE
jgi:hypothetical protein